MVFKLHLLIDCMFTVYCTAIALRREASGDMLRDNVIESGPAAEAHLTLATVSAILMDLSESYYAIIHGAGGCLGGLFRVGELDLVVQVKVILISLSLSRVFSICHSFETLMYSVYFISASHVWTALLPFIMNLHCCTLCLLYYRFRYTSVSDRCNRKFVSFLSFGLLA